MIELHPAMVMIFGGVLAGILPRRLRQVAMIAVPILALFSVINLSNGTVWIYPFINNLELTVLHVDKFSWIFAFILCLITLLANIYALHVKKGGEIIAALLYAGSSLGVVFAGDWITLIFFWEIMAISSVFLVWYKGTKRALAAGFRYILIHFFGGSVLLAGIFLKVMAGETQITVLTGSNGLAFWLILCGIGINAAIPPLHSWLTDAYPESTVTGAIYMNSFTSKVAVFCLIRVFPGLDILLWAGIIMAFYGVVFAVLENNIRRLLSYHIISQLGMIIAGIGIGSELAINGALALAIGNILYKSLLFMSTGAVIHTTGRYKLTELGGLYRTMPLNLLFFTIGALAISGAPLLNGFISKPMVITAATLSHMPLVELLLYMSGIGTFLSIALKLEYYLFFGEDKGIKPQKVPVNMYVAMAGVSLVCIVYGLFPNLLYQKLPYEVSFVPYTLDHVISDLQLLAAAFVPFWILLPKLKTHNTISLDLDWFYRKPFAAFINYTVQVCCKIRDESGVLGYKLLNMAIPLFKNPLKWVALEDGTPAREVYQEDTYRFPIAVPILLCIIAFVVTASCIWIS